MIYFTEKSRWVPLKFARYNEVFFSYRKSSIKLSRRLIISSLFEGEGLNRDGGLNMFNLETKMVWLLHKAYKVEKLKYRKF